MDHKDAYIEQLENTIKELQNQVNNLTEMVLLLRKDKFGPSSEKTSKQVEGQLSLFNEAEFETDTSVPEPIQKTVKGYVRTGSRKKREELIKDLPVREILCETDPDELFCAQCNTSLKPIGKEVVREELEYIPAKLQIVRYVRMVYMSTENSVNRSLKTRSLLTKFGTCSIAATGAVTTLLLFRSRFHCAVRFRGVCRNRLPYQSDKLCM